MRWPPLPRHIEEIVSDKIQKFKTVKLPEVKGKSGMTFKGMKSKAFALRDKGKIDLDLEKKMFSIPIHRCRYCKKCFEHISTRNQHIERTHFRKRHW